MPKKAKPILIDDSIPINSSGSDFLYHEEENKLYFYDRTEYEWVEILGSQGPVGPVGPAGPAGQNGVAGQPGQPGLSGSSAYQIALSNGFSGTQQQWLASLVGPQGPQGPQGTADASGAIAAHESDTTNIHGIANTANLLTIQSASATYATISSPTFTGTLNAPDIVSTSSFTSTGLTTIYEVAEVITTGVVNLNVFTANAQNGNIFYVTSSSANFTINITNVPTTNDRVFSFTFFVIQGSTGYIPNVLQLDGSSQTIKWSGGNAPTATSGVGKIDVFNFTVIRRSSTWEVLGDVSKNY